MGHALECFLFMFSLVLLACRREGSTHDDTQEDVITTAVRPLLSLYGVLRQDVGVVECLFFFFNKKSVFLRFNIVLVASRLNEADAQPRLNRDGLIGASSIRQTTQKRCDTVGNKGRGAWKISQGLEGRTGTVYGRFIVCVLEAHSDRDA